MELYRKRIVFFIFILGITLLCWFSFSNLTESPPIWMDEGIILQTARNFSISSLSGLRIDPQTIVSAGYVTTSYPVTLPISIVFSLFGDNLFNARIVMAIFIIFLVISTFFWLKNNRIGNIIGNISSNNILILTLSIFLIITFPPLYGHGKNVLGEIPGLFFLFSSMILLEIVYESYINSLYSFKKKIFLTIVTFIFIGLTIVTKPIFILLLPALFIPLIINFRQVQSIVLNKSSLLLICTGVLSFVTPIIFWLLFQFHGETFREMLAIYANPHSTMLKEAVTINLLRFINEGQPIYTAILILVWTTALIIRFKKREKINYSELVLWFFSILIIFAYLRTIGYYRYFFIAQFIALTMFPSNLLYLAHIFYNRLYKVCAITICLIFIGIQSYTLLFTSWTAQYSKSKQTFELEQFFSDIHKNSEIFVYQAPEIVTFISHENYSQFMDITETIRVGSTSLDRIIKGLPYIIATNAIYSNHIKNISNNKYIMYKTIGKYQFFRKK